MKKLFVLSIFILSLTFTNGQSNEDVKAQFSAIEFSYDKIINRINT